MKSKIHKYQKNNALSRSKKIFFAAVMVFSITLVSCTSDAIEGNSGSNVIKSDINQTLKTRDTTGGQGGTVPPPPPPVHP